MKPMDGTVDCQVPSLPQMATGEAETPPKSLSRRIKLMIRRRMSPRTERQFKKRTNDLMNWIGRTSGKPELPLVQVASGSTLRLQAGDVVRIRPRQDIDATLNHWRQLRGCTFMPEMDAYCGTVQKVLKPMERFVDERDLTVKTAKGIVLLEGVYCKGTADFGRCDRSCVLFWREEWLEKIDHP
jgi:hypothetical protein